MELKFNFVTHKRQYEYFVSQISLVTYLETLHFRLVQKKCISTPLDMISSKFLIKTADVIKVASGDNNFFPLLKELLRSNKPLIISTGMTNSYEIKSLANYIYKNLIVFCLKLEH